MAALAEVNKIIAFLRMENPLEDISVNPVVEHPHNTSRTIPERLPAATVKELSRLDPARALRRIAIRAEVFHSNHCVNEGSHPVCRAVHRRSARTASNTSSMSRGGQALRSATLAPKLPTCVVLENDVVPLSERSRTAGRAA